MSEDKFSDVYKAGEEFAKDLDLKDSKDLYNTMISAGKEFKKKLGLNDKEVYKKVGNIYAAADTERVKQAIDKCTKKYGELLRRLGSE